jgi:uncharacterized membrane protein
MSSGSPDLVLFFGRFHPMLVHLPIGGLVLLELLAKCSRFKDAAQGNRLILGLTAAASVTAALLGWMLSQSGDYDPQLLQWHQWTGFAVATTCTLTFLLSWLGRLRAYRLSLLATLSVLVVASHLGASITHGRDFLISMRPRPCAPYFREEPGCRKPARQAPTGCNNACSPRSFSPSCCNGAQLATDRRNRKPSCAWIASKPC